jgi:acetyltransferase
MLTADPGRKSGEFAVVVGDQWQGLGLGSRLTDCIIEVSREMGLERIYAFISSDNLRMIDLCAKKGFKIEKINGELIKASLNII